MSRLQRKRRSPDVAFEVVVGTYDQVLHGFQFLAQAPRRLAAPSIDSDTDNDNDDNDTNKTKHSAASDTDDSDGASSNANASDDELQVTAADLDIESESEEKLKQILRVRRSLDKTSRLRRVFIHGGVHMSSIRCLAVSRKGGLLSGSADQTIRAYDLKKKVEVGCLLQHDGKITDLEFASNGKWAVSAATDGKLVLWRTQDWVPAMTLDAHDEGSEVVLSIHPSSRMVLSLVRDDVTRLQKKAHQQQAAHAKSASKHAGSAAAPPTASCGFSLKLWSLLNGKCAFQRRLEIPLPSGGRGGAMAAIRAISPLAVVSPPLLEWSESGNSYAVANISSVLLYNAETGELNVRIEADWPILSMAFVGDSYLAIGDEKGHVQVFNVESGKQVCELEQHKSRIKGIGFVRDSDSSGLGGFLVSAGSDGDMVVWDMHQVDVAEGSVVHVALSDAAARYKISGRITCLAVWSRAPVPEPATTNASAEAADEAADDASSTAPAAATTTSTSDNAKKRKREAAKKVAEIRKRQLLNAAEPLAHVDEDQDDEDDEDDEDEDEEDAPAHQHPAKRQKTKPSKLADDEEQQEEQAAKPVRGAKSKATVAKPTTTTKTTTATTTKKPTPALVQQAPLGVVSFETKPKRKNKHKNWNRGGKGK